VHFVGVVRETGAVLDQLRGVLEDHEIGFATLEQLARDKSLEVAAAELMADL